MTDSEEIDISWNERLEDYFASAGEKAHCLSWLHKRSEAMYSKRSTFIDLPVIVLSTITGAASIGSKGLFGDSEMAPVALGIVSLFISVLNTVGTYFAWARRAEAHRISYLQYSKMYRLISVELSLPRNERNKPKDFLKYVRNEYDRLNEISPLIPATLISVFNHKFSHEKEISQPEEVNGLEKITVYNPEPTKVDSATTPPTPIQIIPPTAPEIPTVENPPIETPRKSNGPKPWK